MCLYIKNGKTDSEEKSHCSQIGKPVRTVKVNRTNYLSQKNYLHE